MIESNPNKLLKFASTTYIRLWELNKRCLIMLINSLCFFLFTVQSMMNSSVVVLNNVQCHQGYDIVSEAAIYAAYAVA